MLTLLLQVASLANVYAEDVPTAWDALRQGNAVIIMRHSLAPDDGPASPLTRAVCADERNLSQAGRDQAEEIGALFRENGIEEASTYSSDVCRCVDTATLFGYDEPEILPAINSFFNDRSAEPKQTEALKQWIQDRTSSSSTPAILVTHGLNVSALTGDFLMQGEFLVVAVEQNDVVVLATASK